MNITSNIYQVGGPAETHPSDAAIYLIRHGDDAALVDAGTGRGTEYLFINIGGTGTSLDAIRQLFLTHCHYDHTGGAAAVKKRTSCTVIAHELEADFLEMGDSEVTAASWYGTYMEPLKIDIRMEGRVRDFKVGGLTVTMHHTPGHSPGSTVLTTVSDGLLVLFGQDVHGPLNDSLRSSRTDYENSLEYMLSLEADILCEGHFGVYRGKEEVRDFIESFL